MRIIFLQSNDESSIKLGDEEAKSWTEKLKHVIVERVLNVTQLTAC